MSGGLLKIQKKGALDCKEGGKEGGEKSTALIRLKPMKMRHYIKPTDFKHFFILRGGDPS